MLNNSESITEEAVSILQKLIQFNTSNPPGNELPALKWLQQLAEENHLHCIFQQTDQSRGNLIISYNNSFKSPLILISHVDVVGANESDWLEKPFDGVVKDGVIWGRGTIDCKQLITMELMSLFILKRNQINIENDIVLIITCDEESGSELGMKKVLEIYSDMFQDAFVISEGGGFPILVEDKPYYLCETGQKGNCKISITVNKSTNNTYFQDLEEFHTSALLIERLQSFEWKVSVPKTTTYLFSKLLHIPEEESVPKVEIMLQLLEEKVTPELFRLLKAMTTNTLTPTIWRGSRKKNEETSIMVDCRILPGTKLDEIEKVMEQVVKDLNASWEIKEFSAGYESNYQTPLFDLFNKEINNYSKDSIVVPFITIGSSDGRFLNKYNANVYGFSPTQLDVTFEKVLPLVHGVNERIPINSLIFGIEILSNSIKQYCTTKQYNETDMKDRVKGGKR